MSKNNNNKLCRDCHRSVDLEECKTEKALFRAKQLGLCKKCQDRLFGA